jgi:hypothetical protein
MKYFRVLLQTSENTDRSLEGRHQIHFCDIFGNKIYPFKRLDRSLRLKEVETSKYSTQLPHKCGGIMKRFMKNYNDPSGIFLQSDTILTGFNHSCTCQHHQSYIVGR